MTGVRSFGGKNTLDEAAPPAPNRSVGHREMRGSSNGVIHLHTAENVEKTMNSGWVLQRGRS
jgi:hypothetical protein